MKIVLTGGGSGGHITPLVAVAHELKRLDPGATIIYVGQRGDSLIDLATKNPAVDEAYVVRAGKFRRYSGEGIKQLFNGHTVFKNIRDSVRVLLGLLESHQLLKKLKPDIIFIKGGYVGVPVGLAAAQLGIPYITHDSDAIPGLANKIIARWARLHAVALPVSVYPYPVGKTVSVGVPISSKFVHINDKLKAQYRQELGLNKYKTIIFVTGGGNGARQLNNIITASSARLLHKFSDLAIVHLSGKAFEAETIAAYKASLPAKDTHRVTVKGFVLDLYRYSGAADIIIGRGSATNLAEFAVQAKPCVIIPARQLPWTVRNTEELTKVGAIVALREDELIKGTNALIDVCTKLINDGSERQHLGECLRKELAHPNAAVELARLIIQTAAGGRISDN